MSQKTIQQRRFQPCRNQCGTDIFFENSKLGRTDKGGWIPLQLDSIGQATKHECPNRMKNKERSTSNVSATPQKRSPPKEEDLSKEVAEIKAWLLVILDRLTTLEKELQK